MSERRTRQMNRNQRRYLRPFCLSVGRLVFALGMTGVVTASLATPLRAAPDVAPFDSGDFLAALISMHAGDIRQADLALARARQAMPDAQFLSHDAFRYAAMDVGPDKPGLDAARRAVALAPRQPRDELALVVLGDDALMRGDAARAFDLFSANGPVIGPLMRLSGPILQAWCLQGRGQGDAALARLAKSSADQPFSGISAMHAALIALQAQTESVAEPRVRGALMRAHADDPHADLVLARAYAGWLTTHGQAGQARSLLKNWLAVHPDLAPAKRWFEVPDPSAAHMKATDGIALAYLALASGLEGSVGANGKLAENGQQVAIILSRQAIALAPNNLVVRLQLAGVLMRAGDLGGGLMALSPMTHDTPLGALAAVARAAIEDRQNRLQAAMDDLDVALKADPANPDLHAALGDLAARSNQPARAAAEYTQSLAEIPMMAQRRWSLLLARGSVLEMTGDWLRAHADLAQALALAPDEPIVLNAIGYGAVEHGDDLATATTRLRHAVALVPDDAAIRDSLGWALLKGRHVEQALPLLQSAAERTPRDPEVNYHLGMAYWELGRRSEAIDQWNQALSDHPEPHDRRDILDALATLAKAAPHIQPR